VSKRVPNGHLRGMLYGCLTYLIRRLCVPESPCILVSQWKYTFEYRDRG
jgi:hypothetical protein